MFRTLLYGTILYMHLVLSSNLKRHFTCEYFSKKYGGLKIVIQLPGEDAASCCGWFLKQNFIHAVTDYILLTSNCSLAR